jgi:riboflavin transporter FmnP
MEIPVENPLRSLNDRIFPGIGTGFMTGLFTGSVAGIFVLLLRNETPDTPFGIGIYAFEGAMMGAVIGIVIATTFLGIRNRKSTRWVWALIAAAAAALAVMIAQPYSSQLPSALLILPLQAAVSAWIVEHILLSIPSNLYNLQQTRPTRMRMMYITGFGLITALLFTVILLTWSFADALL